MTFRWPQNGEQVSKKPDLVIVDKRTKSVHKFELTVPGVARLVIKLKKQNIVIVDKRTKSVHIFELTVPGEARLVITLKKPDIVIVDKRTKSVHIFRGEDPSTNRYGESGSQSVSYQKVQAAVSSIRCHKEASDDNRRHQMT